MWTDPVSIPEPGAPASELARWEHTRLRRRMLYGLWRADLVARVNLEVGGERADAWGEPDLTGNLFRPTCSALSQLYTPDAPRVTPGVRGGEVLVDAVERGGLWGLMIRGQRDTIGLREWLVRVDAVEDPSAPLGYSLSFRPVYPDRVCAVGRADAPDLPGYLAEAVLVDRGDGRGPRWLWDEWDTTTGIHRLVTDLGPGGIVEEMSELPKDEYGRYVLPYSLYHAERTGWLFDAWEWLEIVEGSLRLGVDWTFFGHALLKASWPQRLAIGVDFAASLSEADDDGSGRGAPVTKITADPAKVLIGTIPADQTAAPVLHQWGAGAPLTEIADSITTYERRIAALAGINPADIQRVTGDPRSGYAIEISRDEQDRARKRFEPTFRRGDLETLRVAAAVLSQAAGARVPSVGYAIEYGPPPEEEVAVDESGAPVAAVQDTALNGAQVTSLIQLVADVAAGQIPRDAAIAIAQRAFQVDEAEAEALLGSAGNGFTVTPAPAPAAFGGDGGGRDGSGGANPQDGGGAGRGEGGSGGAPGAGGGAGG